MLDPVEARQEAAHYVASLAVELAQIARRHGMHTLGYLLEMVQFEAESLARKPNGRRN